MAFVLVLLAGSASAQTPLHARVDELLAASQTGPASPVANDAEFLRRLTLDLVGTIPSPADVRAFLADTNPAKRTQAVDRLLADPRFPLHQAEVFDVLLMERRPDKHVPHVEWLKYLQMSLQANKPWNQLVRELVTTDGTDPATRPASKFFLDREGDPHILTRDVGRIFFGVDLQCAQCHDHPLVDHYAQSDYYGLHAFVSRTVLFNDEAQKKMLLGERAEGEVDYKSVFTGDAGRIRPRLPGGTELDEPHFRWGDEYVTAPANKVRPVPKHSRRMLLAKMTEGGNAAFDRNLPNRIWANLFGRGLVHPVDWHHPHNPPVHPAVLDAITADFVASGYNIRSLIRELVLTQAYQRSFDYPADRTQRVAVATQLLPALEARLAELEPAVKAAGEQAAAAYAAMKSARDALAAPEQVYQKTLQDNAAAKKPMTDAEAALTKTQQAATAKQTVIAALTEAHAKGAEAAKAVPNDAEIATAVGVFHNKLTAANTELAALQKTATDQTAALEPLRAKLAEVVNASETAYAAYIEAAKAWEATKPAWSTTRQAAIAADVQRQLVKDQIARWKKSADYGQQLAQLTASEQAVPIAQQELQQTEVAMTEQTSVVAKVTAEVAAAQQTTTAAAQQLELARAEVANRQTIAKPVADAAVQVEAALQKLPGDTELTDVLAKLKARYEPLGSAVKEAETVTTTRTSEHAAATQKLQAAQQQMQQADQELTTRKQTLATKAAALQQAQTKVTETKAAIDTAWTALATTWERELSTRTEKPLSPEQMTYAVLQGTGILDGQRAAADAEIEKTVPKASVEADPAKLSARQAQVEQLLRERMRGHVNA
ncbi:MAG TPA: DUF1549 domain-containing protein, partial [Planctomycetaceae bacterium]|nr:DUF1549 domain-containing protein [Planctomycetaceae bacterium]